MICCSWHCCQKARKKDFVLCPEHWALELKWGRVHHFREVVVIGTRSCVEPVNVVQK